MAPLTLRYLNAFKDRHGIVRYYYRRGGKRQAIEGDFGTEEFGKNYERIHASFEGKKTPLEAPGTFGALVTAYYSATEFTQLRASTRSEYRRMLEGMRADWGALRADRITKKVIKAHRDSLADRPPTANSSLRVLKTLMAFGVDSEIIPDNPAKGVKSLKTGSDGWAPWPDESVEKFIKEALGAPRHAFFLALYTGQRRADVLAMRWDDISDGGITVKQQKTGAALWIPIHPDLKLELTRILAEREAANAERIASGKDTINGETIVQKRDGTPYSDDGFGTIWNREQHRVGVVGLPFHGLRKCATQALFEAGCTPQEVQAITGHATLQMVEHYGRGANQRRMAGAAMRKLTDESGDGE